MRIRYQTSEKHVFEGTVIGNPVFNPNHGKMFFLVKSDEGIFKEIKCEECIEIFSGVK